MPGDIKIGIIGRADNTGLGVETWEFCRHFPDTKVLIVNFESLGDKYRIFPERFNNPTIVKDYPQNEALEEFFKDIDLLFTIEAPYNKNTYKIARRMGVKSILRVNYEWLYDWLDPDFYIAPSLYHYDDIPTPKKYLPFPINRKLLPFKLRKKAKKFIHIAGNMKAAYDRNGTELLLQAVPLIKDQDIEIIIKSQAPIECADPRVRVELFDYDNYWEIWEDADVYISPRRYAGQSLPLNEAMSLGLAVIMTDMEPQSGFLPHGLLIRPTDIKPLKIAKQIEMADIDPKDIAAKIDEIAGNGITEYSRISNEIAEQWSWKTLKPQYEELFKNICLYH